MKKLLIYSGLSIGGVESFSIGLSNELANRGYNVYFIMQDEGFSSEFSKLLNETIQIITSENSLQKKFIEPSTHFIIPYYADTFLNSLYDAIKKNRNLPTIHGYVHNDGPYYYDSVKIYNGITSNFIAVSNSIYNKLKEFQEIDQSKLIYQKCPLLFESNIFKPKSDKVKLLFVGRIENESKGVFRLVDIAEFLQNSSLDYEITVIGTGSDLNLLKQKVRNNNLNSKFLFIENLNCPNEVIPYYEENDVLLILSNYEGGPLVLYEAMECSTVPVGFNVGVLPEVIDHGVNGFYFDHNNFNGLLQTISFLANSKDIDTLKKNAAQKIKELNLSMSDYLAFLEPLIQTDTKTQIDNAISQVDAINKEKYKDFNCWVKKLVGEDNYKRNNLNTYLNYSKVNWDSESSKHYNIVYENMPKWWKKLGALIRKFK